MKDIKLKKKSNIKIKKLDKAKMYPEKLKKNLINVKEKVNDNGDDEGNIPIKYALNQVTDKSKVIMYKGINQLNRYGKESVQKTNKNIQKAKQGIKKKMQMRNIKKNEKDIKVITSEGNARNKNKTKIFKRMEKNAPKTTENVMKNTKKIFEEKTKGLKKAYQITRTTASKSIISIKKGISAIRKIIATTKALILAIIAGRLDCYDNNCSNMLYNINLWFGFGYFIIQ